MFAPSDIEESMFPSLPPPVEKPPVPLALVGRRRRTGQHCALLFRGTGERDAANDVVFPLFSASAVAIDR